MKKIKRIAIIGNAGSGKSTLAYKLKEKLDLPVYHLDQYYWKPNWQRPTIDEYKIIHDKLCDQDEWIIDGVNLKVMEYRIAKADIIIFLDIPRYKCFYRIFKRTLKYYGKQTPSGAKDCFERFNWEFILFLKWVWDFKTKYPPKIMNILNSYKDKKIYIFKSQREIDNFLNSF